MARNWRDVRADAVEAGWIKARTAADNGNRTDLDDAITMLGYTRAELEAEIEADERDG